jgi:uncharacterized membrane protein YeaQ/YmgE (transglycosylase-associated protein family)
MDALSEVTLLANGGNILAWLILGGIAGTVAGRLLYGRAFGFIGNIILGLIGAFVGGEIADIFINGAFQLWGSLVIAILGSILVVWVWGTLTHKQRENR